jgi:hypothetical protein
MQQAVSLARSLALSLWPVAFPLNAASLNAKHNNLRMLGRFLPLVVELLATSHTSLSTSRTSLTTWPLCCRLAPPHLSA